MPGATFTFAGVTSGAMKSLVLGPSVAAFGLAVGVLAASKGEWLGLAAAIGLMYLTSNEFFSAITACAIVALARMALT